ncbi:MAG: YkgJ family cysteine cluster protein [Desulfomonile sp.]|jgi:uncharacterized cysteine cluster protein YcgN (CxxCxxCC family)|nr:YkgJ family cysteine cluster protein [Deltaproteobacteria bacterium]
MVLMDQAQWDAICRKCGQCCYEKLDLGGGLIRYTDQPCVHLDTETKLCKVYEKRGQVEPDCINLTEQLVREFTWLPEDCAYVEHVRFKDTLAAVRKAHKPDRKRRHND